MKYTITLTPQYVPLPPDQVPAYNHALRLLAKLVHAELQKQRQEQAPPPAERGRNTSDPSGHNPNLPWNRTT